MLALFAVFSLLAVASAQIGTKLANVSSDSQQLTYVGTWRSDTSLGVYEAYSNASDAEVTFTFTGVAASYVVIKKFDRGLCMLKVDGDTSYTVDLYDNSGYAQSQTVLWTSPTLPYGTHNVTLSQIGVDARIGVYPYLFTETWIQAVPTDVASYTATQVLTTATTGITSPTGSPGNSTSSSTNLAPIIGGAVGGVIACFLLGFLVYLWRKDKKRDERGGAMIKKAKKAEGKMAIEDDTDPRGYNGYGGAASPWSAHDYGSSNNYSGNDSYQTPNTRMSDGTDPAHYGYGQPLPYPTSSPAFTSGMYGSRPNSYEPMAFAHDGSLSPSPRPQGAYPYHTHGQGEDTRAYPVPEI